MNEHLVSAFDRLDRVLKDMDDRLDQSERLKAVSLVIQYKAEFSQLFSGWTSEVAAQLGAAFSSVSIVDADHSIILGVCGVDLDEQRYPREHSYCQYVAGTGYSFCVENSLLNPLVRFQRPSTDPGLKVMSYYGAPIFSSGHWPLGAFCVADTKARRWTPEEIGLVDFYARKVSEVLAVLGLRP